MGSAPAGVSDPHAIVDEVAASQARVDAAIAGLDDAAMRQPSRLPGWSVGHVLTHIARNADSHVRRTEAAWRGESIDQYPGGFEGRASAIDAGAHRPAAEIVADVRETGALADARWRATPDPAWSVVSLDVGGTERALRDLPGRRWQELEVHLVDLGLGASHRDWPDAFVAYQLPRMRGSLARRLPPGVVPPVLDPHDELAWLYDRFVPAGAPALGAWG